MAFRIFILLSYFSYIIMGSVQGQLSPFSITAVPLILWVPLPDYDSCYSIHIVIAGVEGSYDCCAPAGFLSNVRGIYSLPFTKRKERGFENKKIWRADLQ